MAFDYNAILAGVGGFVGMILLLLASYHNYKMRLYAKRQTIALEKLAKEMK